MLPSAGPQLVINFIPDVCKALAEMTRVTKPKGTSYDDYWKPFLERQGPAGAYAASLSAADREALRLRLRARPLGTGPDRAIVMQARAWAVRGTVR